MQIHKLKGYLTCFFSFAIRFHITFFLSFCLNLLYFICFFQVGIMKEKYDHRLLLKHLPSDFRQFLDHILTLEYFDKPDYALLSGLFERCMKRRGIKENDPYDWEKNFTDNSVTTTVTTSPAVISKPPLAG